jgi:uncharacterized protein
MFVKKANIPSKVRAKLKELGIPAVQSKLDHVIGVRRLDDQDKKEEPLGDGLMASGREMREWLAEQAAWQSWWPKAGVIVAMILGLVSIVVSVWSALRETTPVYSNLADPFQQGVAAWNRGDYATALQLFRPLAERGNIRAQALLGFSYASGSGVPQDYAEAAKWYQRAADTGDDIAQYNIGIMHQNGQGVPQDLVRAYMWLDLAAMRGHQGAAMDRDKLVKSMTAAQIAEAQELARKWKPKTP